MLYDAYVIMLELKFINHEMKNCIYNVVLFWVEIWGKKFETDIDLFITSIKKEREKIVDMRNRNKKEINVKKLFKKYSWFGCSGSPFVGISNSRSKTS